MPPLTLSIWRSLRRLPAVSSPRSSYLSTYPYGCTEQTMSSFLPNLVVADTLKKLNLSGLVSPADLQAKTNAGLDRLNDLRHDDGGWGWWKEDQSRVFMTAYVVSGLAQAKAAGYDKAAANLPGGVRYLQQQLAQHPRMIPELRAYVTLCPQPGRRAESWPFGRNPVVPAQRSFRGRACPYRHGHAAHRGQPRAADRTIVGRVKPSAPARWSPGHRATARCSI